VRRREFMIQSGRAPSLGAHGAVRARSHRMQTRNAR